MVHPSPLRSELPMLKEITANPKIMKILHGCDSDTNWLQRDLTIYLRDVLDTHQAGKLLGVPTLSLFWVMSNYCGNDVDQLADWRIKPLTNDMVFYAREDSRYRIYLCTRLKNKLIPCEMEDSHLEVARKARTNLNNKHLFCFKVCFFDHFG